MKLKKLCWVGGYIMDKLFNKQLYSWTYEKIKNNPKKFGSDSSSNLIMHEYTKDFYSEYYVSELEPRIMSTLNTVVRIKNRILKKYPQYDSREKYKRIL
jgi:hypothetical protein